MKNDLSKMEYDVFDLLDENFAHCAADAWEPLLKWIRATMIEYDTAYKTDEHHVEREMIKILLQMLNSH